MRVALWTAATIVAAGLAAGCGDGPTSPAEFGFPQVHAGEDFTCALGLDSRVRCWGRNHVGQLGDGTTQLRVTPGLIFGDLRFASISTRGTSDHVCGVTAGGAAYCWGANGFGQLGDGTENNSTIAVRVVGDHKFKSVSAGWLFSCGITDSNEAYCWGRGVWGQLGDGRAIQSLVPVKVSGDITFETVEAGASSLTCGLGFDEAAYCWGLNWRGEIGAPTDETCINNSFELQCAKTPVRVNTTEGSNFKAISAGNTFACGVLTSGAAFCWGQNSSAQLGTESTGFCSGVNLPTVPCSRVPLPVLEDLEFENIETGETHACAVTKDKDAWCWGNNLLGQLGDGLFANSASPPAKVQGGHEFVAISPGASHTCGTTVDRQVYCWGINLFGQIGNDTTTISRFPVLVEGGV